jgi:hypothetical protein
MQAQVIRYDLLVQDALRGMVRELLSKVAREGLPGDHHFFITFKTQAPGVQLSQRMKARYPDEITIILQHQFWDLVVNERQFEVGLSFSNIPERLIVPFSALTGFHDPSAPFMVKFEPKDAAEAQQGDEQAPAAAPTPLRAIRPETGAASEAIPEPDGAQGAALAPAMKREPAATPSKTAGANTATGKPTDSNAAEKDASEAKPAEASKIVSIDAFRKKT